MPDDTLQIGAQIDLGELLPGLDKMASSTADATASMGVAFTNLEAKTSQATSTLSIDIEKLIASNEAVAESSAAMAGTITAAMTSIRSKTVESAVESETSLAGLKEAFTGVAESAELSAAGTVSALGPLGALLGVGVLTNYAENLKEVVLSMDRLASVTGEPIERLVEFRDAMEHLGVPTENVSRVLLHVAEEARMAADGEKEASDAFKQLGINTDDWNGKAPSTLDLLLKISDYMNRYRSTSESAGAITQVLGLRMGVELAGGLSAGSKAIEELMGRAEGLGKETAAAVDGAKRWQDAEAELASGFRSLFLPVVSTVADALGGLSVVVAALKAYFLDWVTVVTEGAGSVFETLGTVGIVFQDLAHLDFSGAKAAVTGWYDDIKARIPGAVAAIKTANQEVEKSIEELAINIRKPLPPPKLEPPPDDTKKPGDDRVANARIEGEEKADAAIIEERLAAVKNLVAIGQASWADEIAAETTAENQLFQVKSQALAAQQALAEKQSAGGDKGAAARVEEINSQIEILDAKHQETLARLDAETTAKMIADLKQYDAEQTRAQEAQQKAAQKTQQELARGAEEEMRIDEAQISMAQEVANRQLRAAQSADDEKLRTHKISIDQYVEDETKAINDWYTKQHAALEAALADAKAIYGQMSVEYQKLIAKEEALDVQKEQMTEKMTEKANESFNKMFERATGAFNSNITQWIMGYERFGQAARKIEENLAQSVIENLLKSTEQRIVASLTKKTLDHEDIMGDAAKAASGAWASTVDIPIVGPILAPAAAAAAFTGVMAFGSFDEGGLAEKSGLAMVHQSEITMPPAVSSAFRSMAERGEMPGGGTTNHFSFHQGAVSALDARGADRVMRKSGAEITRTVMRTMRNAGALNRGGLR